MVSAPYDAVLLISMVWIFICMIMIWLASGTMIAVVSSSWYRDVERQMIWGGLIGFSAVIYLCLVNFIVDEFILHNTTSEALRVHLSAAKTFCNLVASILGIGVGGNLIAQAIIGSNQRKETHVSTTPVTGMVRYRAKRKV